MVVPRPSADSSTVKLTPLDTSIVSLSVNLGGGGGGGGGGEVHVHV